MGIFGWLVATVGFVFGIGGLVVWYLNSPLENSLNLSIATSATDAANIAAAVGIAGLIFGVVGLYFALKDP